MRLRTVVVMGLLVAPLGTFACDIEFSGSAFLKSSHTHGIRPQSDCYLVDLSANKFYAPPNSSCHVLFDSESWFSDGWEFKDIRGVGGFKINSIDSGFEVVIDEKKGFFLKSVVVTTSYDDCSEVRVEDGL